MIVPSLLLVPLGLAGAWPAAPPQDGAGGGFAAQAARVEERVLDNGLTVIVLPRGEAPVVSFHLHVEAGSMDEVSGQTGLAHFAEHMAFKGSPRIGSQDWEAEREALAACDAAWALYETAVESGEDVERVQELHEAFESAREQADALTEAAAFDHAVEEAGGAGNASTGADGTNYFVSVPAQYLETFFWLTREQIGAPVMREFYKERDVVMEERRLRVESSAYGALMEAVLNTAFVAHPYRDSTIGHMDDLRFLDRQEMSAFWDRHYTADRMVLAVVGRVEPEDVFGYAEEYLGDLPRGRAPRPRRTTEPPQEGERVVRVIRPAAPRVALAWKAPVSTGRTGLAQLALGEVLAGGPASRLEERLVKEERIVASVNWWSGDPGDVDPALFVVMVRPLPGASLEACADAVQEEMDRLARGGPTERELAGARRRAKMDILGSLETNADWAWALAENEVLEGGWRYLFTQLDALDAIGAVDVAQMAATFTLDRRTTGYLVPAGRGAGEGGR